MARYSSRTHSKIGRKISFYDVKTGKKSLLTVEGIKKYSLAKGRNSRRSRGRCSFIAYAYKGSRKLYKIVGNQKCSSSRGSSGFRAKTRYATRASTRRRSRRRSTRRKSRRRSRSRSRRRSRH